MVTRYKRSEVHPETGLTFFAYSRGREVWVTTEKFREWVERARKLNKKWRDSNPERYKELAKKSRVKYKDQRNADNKQWRIKNPVGRRKWDNAHPEKRREYTLRYRAKRRVEDPLYRLRLILASRTANIFKLAGIKKKQRSSEYLGCSIEYFKKHIESQFLTGMTWENQGQHIPGGLPKWNIDHIFPLSKARDEKHLKQLCHYTNQRPLWGVDNLKKSDRIVIA